MKTAWSLLAVALLFAFTVSARAEEGKKVTLKGTITCAKCDLKIEKACTTVIKVKEKDKDVVYYFDPASGKKHHKAICTEPKKGTVTGTVEKKGDKMVITVSELKFDE
jgi:hypothetical protein